MPFPVAPIAALAFSLLALGADASAESTAPLEAARADASIPFELRVDCTDQDSRRSLQVIRGSIAVWGNERQVRLSSEDREALLDLLVDADFPRFAPRYGETPKAEKQEAPLRVSCRIHVAVPGLEKSSVQLLDGEQSEQLLRLARQLLDRIEPLAAGGVTATSLEDGLAKLADQTLAPEVLGLRFVTLPDAGGSAPGTILRIEGGQISKQDYAPGEAVGAVHTRDLAACQLRDIISALRDARLWELPINLREDGVIELEVRVLSQSKTVIARSSFSPAPDAQQTAFAGLLTQLAAQPSACND